MKNLLFYVFITLAVVLILFLLCIKTDPDTDTFSNNKDFRKKISEIIVGDRMDYCHAITPTNSYGTILDEVLICNIVKSLPSAPVFGIERVTSRSSPSDWLFVNLDCTDWPEVWKVQPKLLCKTKQAYKVLSEVYDKNEVIYTGFTSFDRFSPDIKPDYGKFLHLPGKSHSKGTHPLVYTWTLHPEWPELTVIAREGLAEHIKSLIGKCNNVNLIAGHMPEEKLIQIVNSHGIHLCVSEYEGYGHNINEARSVEAVALYTDRPCMNEGFTPESGIPVACEYKRMQNKYCPHYLVTQEGIETAMETVLSLSHEKLAAMGKKSRQNFLRNDANFKNNLQRLVIGQKKIPRIIHTVWISKETPFQEVEIPEKYEKYIKTWKEKNKGFKFIHWSGKSILNLVGIYFPQYLDYYKNLSPNICKCDFARFAIVAVHGGVYTDLDFFCRKSITPLLICEQYFVMETLADKNLFNGFFAACPGDVFILGWLDQMSKNKGDVMQKTGPIGLYKYAKKTKNTFRLGNPCSALSISDRHTTVPQCSGYYDTYIATTWGDGSVWDNAKREESKSKDGVGKKYNSSVEIKREINPIINSLQLYWENSKFTGDNFPGLYYDIKEKQQIFQLSKNIPQGYGVIDVGAHIGDLAIPLAQALAHIGREDVVVYAIDPTKDKCDFIDRMALINTLSNLRVIHAGLNDKVEELGSDSNKGNTGAYKWDSGKDYEKTTFLPADRLLEEGKIGPIGLYHIDVEGMEETVLNGSKNLIRRFKPIICLECWLEKNIKCKNEDDCPYIFNFMKENNYKLQGFLPNDDMIFAPI